MTQAQKDKMARKTREAQRRNIEYQKNRADPGNKEAAKQLKLALLTRFGTK